jgi:hypothetical protein
MDIIKKMDQIMGLPFTVRYVRNEKNDTWLISSFIISGRVKSIGKQDHAAKKTVRPRGKSR